MPRPPFVPRRPGARQVDGDDAPPSAPMLPAALGALAAHARPGVTDLLVDGAGRVWTDAGAGLHPADAPALAPDAARHLAVALVAAGGRHIDDATPYADVRLGGGIRAHAVLPPVATRGALVSVRIADPQPWRLERLVAAGMLDDALADRLRAAVLDRRTVLVAGPAGAGKTSLVSALLAEVPPSERIVTIEDVAELAVDHPHVVGLEARQPNADGAGGVPLGRLVREALRMRPDRLVLGECRGAEVADLFAALGTGHDGGAATLHAASLDDLPARLEALGALAALDSEALARQVVAAIHVVVVLERVGGVRRVASLGRPVLAGGRLAVEALP